VKLNNPPVSQTWIGFLFESSANKRPWDIQSASEFLARFETSFPHREATFATSYEIQEIPLGHRPRIVGHDSQLEKVLARNMDSTHWLQLADNRIVYNRTRGEGVYLGFVSLRDEALSKLAEYVEFFRPCKLVSADLHYVDQIEIPIPPGRKLDLQEYFKLRVEIPDDYGPTWYFSTRLFLHPPIDGDILEVRFQSEPPISDASFYRFRIDWHMVCGNISVFDAETVKQRLDQAHDCLMTYFRASVTERTWALFQPSEEG
jgi:uncharacterized protein (TIGR04255 family)